MTEHTTWQRRLVPVSDSGELCAPFGSLRCDQPVAYVLTYMSAQGCKRTPAQSRREMCADHARRYVEVHGGAVVIEARVAQPRPQPRAAARKHGQSPTAIGTTT